MPSPWFNEYNLPLGDHDNLTHTLSVLILFDPDSLAIIGTSHKRPKHMADTPVCVCEHLHVYPCVCVCVTFPSVCYTQTDFVLPVLCYFPEESLPVIPDSKDLAVAQSEPTRLTSSCFPYWTFSLPDFWAKGERNPRTISTPQYSFRKDFFF